jgi:signal transduction histidine kinase
VVTSVIVFGLAALVLTAVYVGLAVSLGDEPVTREVVRQGRLPDGRTIIVQREELDLYLLVEAEANARALDTLRRYTLAGLGALFVASVGVGWSVAGQVLRPIDRITAVARDITATDLSRRIALDGPRDELVELADTFDDMLGRLDLAFEGQRRFIHEASHELRNPLAAIRTTVEVALADDDPREARRALEVVDRSSDRMATLVDDLLVYARQGRLQAEVGPVDLGAVADGVVADLGAAAHHRGVALVGPTRADRAPQVSGDRRALERALTNLVVNALRHAPPGSTVRVGVGGGPGRAWLSVADEGPGIAPGDQDRIFQRFVRLPDPPGPPPAAGTDGIRSGLGLAIVRQVAEAHGGGVEVASAPGAGAVFTLWVPR